MGKVTKLAFVLVTALGAILIVGQRHIGALLYSRVIEARLGASPLLGLPDGLHVKVCGAGSPLPDPKRAGPCLFVMAGENTFLVDVGAASVRNLMGEQVPLGELDGVFLTHFHSDHIDGLGELLLQRWAQGGHDEPLPVYGPNGVQTVVDGLRAAYRLDAGYRTAHHGEDIMPQKGAGGAARPFGLHGELPVEVYQDDGLTVTANEVDHSPVKPAVAYRFSYKGRSIVISGDAGPNSGLDQFARGTDILFHEALNRDLVGTMQAAAERAAMPRTAKILFDIQDYHTSPEEAAEVAERAQAKALVLYHVVPAVPFGYLEAAFLGDAKSVFSGKLTLAEDGMLFSLPANQ